MLQSVMENSGYEHHVNRLTCLHLDNGSKCDDLIHCHAELLCSSVVFLIEIVLHVVEESFDNGFRARIDVEIICIGIEITCEDEVSAFLDLDLRYEFVVDEKVRRIHALVEFGVIEIEAGFVQDLLDLIICGAFGNCYLNCIRCQCKEIHKLVISKALKEVMCAGYICAVKTVELTYDREKRLVGDKARII